MRNVRHHIQKKADKEGASFALLFDPDDCAEDERLERKIRTLSEHPVDLIFLGGSLLVGDAFERTLARIRAQTDLPIVLFPGSPMQLSDEADGTLLLSLISGRNPELLIGQQVLAAPFLKRMRGAVISTGYMLIDGGKPTTASYMSATTPIPRDKSDIAMSTAMAGELLGMSCIYMDAGSGAEKPIPPEMIQRVRKDLDIPLIVGGGIRDAQGISSAVEAGADLVVIGSAFEEDPHFLNEMRAASRQPQ
ncbi:MAG: geranylgeranylglyceryl/heptaprenylglyceryl phosphate synthase [Flavobacteriales bacterium]